MYVVDRKEGNVPYFLNVLDQDQLQLVRQDEYM